MPKVMTYAELDPGRSFAPSRFKVTAEVIEGYRAATDTAPNPDDGAAAPPIVAAIFSSPRHAFGGRPLPPGCVHARQRYRFLAPIYAGDELETVCIVESRYDKKGRNYVAFRTETRGPRGPVTEGLITMIWAAPS